MTGRECLNSLPILIQEQYEYNFRNDGRRTRYGDVTNGDWERHMRLDFNTMSYFLSASFQWTESREGNDYWNGMRMEYLRQEGGDAFDALFTPDLFIPVRPEPTKPKWELTPFTL